MIAELVKQYEMQQARLDNLIDEMTAITKNFPDTPIKDWTDEGLKQAAIRNIQERREINQGYFLQCEGLAALLRGKYYKLPDGRIVCSEYNRIIIREELCFQETNDPKS